MTIRGTSRIRTPLQRHYIGLPLNAAERWGLDAIWLAEIHLAPERSVLAAPRNIATAIATRTKNVKIGYLGARLEESATRAGITDTARRIAGGQRLQTITYDEALRDKVIVGTPAMVAERLIGLQQQLGLNGILAELNCGGLIPHERVMGSLQLLCEKVQPRLH